MLAVARKNRESVVIGAADKSHGLMRVTILEIQGKTVRLGFETDWDETVAIHHQQVWEKSRSRSQMPHSQHAAEQPRERPPYSD